MRKFLTPRPLALLSFGITLLFSELTLSASSQLSQNETLPKDTPVFRFHLASEPASLDPARAAQGSDGSFFFHNLFRGLYSYENEKGLVSEGAKSCVFKTTLRLECDLSPSHLWSDGSKVLAEDYVRAFRRLLKPGTKSAAADLLRNLKNALAIHSGQLPTDNLGIKAAGPSKIVFEFEKTDPDFLLKLTHSFLTPLKSDSVPEREKFADFLVTGPYRITSWTKGKRIRLETNLHYTRPGEKKTDRPPVEVLFLEDEMTALALYEEGTLTFHRRLPVQLIAKHRDRKDFHFAPFTRFDYLGFGPELQDQPDLRAALSYSLDYDEITRLMHARGRFGCPSLPDQLLSRKTHCIPFDLKKARAHWDKVPDTVRKKRIKLLFSKLGGDDNKKASEWYQAQWKKNLGFDVELEVWEQGSYTHKLRTSPPAIFRRGISLDRPTCLAALETFAIGSSENMIQLKDPEYEKLIEKMKQALRPEHFKKPKDLPPSVRSLCSQAIDRLLTDYRLIPLGQIHFAILAKTTFTGWSLNELGQLDLSRLKANSL